MMPVCTAVRHATARPLRPAYGVCSNLASSGEPPAS